jgi:hypothetical protein
MTFPAELKARVEEASYYEPIPCIVEEIEGVERIEDEIVGTGRWSVDRQAVYKYDNRYWQVSYQEPATEYQDWDKEDYTVHEVFPVEVTVTKYVRATT